MAAVRRIQLVPRSAAGGRTRAVRRPHDLVAPPPGDFRERVDTMERRIRRVVATSDADTVFVVDDVFLPGLLSRLTGELVDPDDLPPGPVTVALALDPGRSRAVSPAFVGGVVVLVVCFEFIVRGWTGAQHGLVAAAVAAVGVALLPARRTRPWGWGLLGGAVVGVVALACVIVFAERIPVN